MSLVTFIPEGIASACGFAGMALCVFAYGYSTALANRPDGPNPYIQHGANLSGALLLVISLLVDTNLASLTMESIWAAIAFAGLVQALLTRKDIV
jgi:hypothetical protein